MMKVMKFFSCIACLMLPGLGVAENTDEALEAEPVIEEVTVTGTRIQRRDFTSPSPLVTITREELEFSGQPTLEDYLNQVPQNQPTSGRTLNNGGDGTAGLNLRAFGPGRTLVMLNGRRVAPSGVGSAVDVNNIPSLLVDRVEIITGGASTVYGSDAIAGVVNFITRGEFEGLSFEGGYNVTSEGDADIWDFNAVYGKGFDNGAHVTVYAGRYEREPLFADQRAITAVPIIDNWFTGELQVGGSDSTPYGVINFPRADLGKGPGLVTWDANGVPRPFRDPEDLYNFQPVNYLQAPLSRDTFGAFGAWPLSDRTEVYFELSYAQNEAEISLAESPFGGLVVINIDNPNLSPETQELFSRPQYTDLAEDFGFPPGFAVFNFRRRFPELGPRIRNYDRRYQRYLTGLRGTFGESWHFDTWLTWTDADEQERYFNDGSRSRLRQGLLVDPVSGQCFDPTGGCVPIDPFGPGRVSAEAADFLRVDNILNSTQRRQTLASAVLTGAPFEIWSGPVDLAIGAEWRRDEVRFKADDVLFTGDTIGFRGTAPVDGTETVIEAFAETVMTLYRDQDSGRKLDLEAGLRWSDYDNAGDADTWKLGLNWEVTDGLAVRTMVQRAVRAPNNGELFTTQFTEFGTFVNDNFADPCSASSDPVGNGNTDKCILQGLAPAQVGVFEAQFRYPVAFVNGGNPDLDPEASDTLTLGLVVNPASIPELVVSVDYWRLELEDAIGGINARGICFDPANEAGLFCDRIQRDETGNVSTVLGLLENRALATTDGIDTQVQYGFDLPGPFAVSGDTARLTLNATWSHVLSQEDQALPFTESVDCVGYYGLPCGYGAGETAPENRLLATFNYRSGPLSANLTWRWIDDVDLAAPLVWDTFGIPNPRAAIPSIPSWSYFDLGVSYNWSDRFDSRFGVNNLFDKKPPLMASNVFNNNTDALMYDVLGRTFYLNFSYQVTGN